MGPVSWQIQLYPNLQTQVPQHQARRPVQSQEDQVKESPVNILPSSCIYISLKMSVPEFSSWDHSLNPACHPGFHRTVDFSMRHFWWSSMAQDTQDFVASCTVCARSKSSHQPSVGFTPNPGDADVPLVPYCTRFSYRPILRSHLHFDHYRLFFKGCALCP